MPLPGQCARSRLNQYVQFLLGHWPIPWRSERFSLCRAPPHVVDMDLHSAIRQRPAAHQSQSRPGLDGMFRLHANHPLGLSGTYPGCVWLTHPTTQIGNPRSHTLSNLWRHVTYRKVTVECGELSVNLLQNAHA